MRLTSSFWSRVKRLSKYPQTSVSLNHLYSFEKNYNPAMQIETAKFLHNEIPIRLSRRTMELNRLKFGLAKNMNIIHTKELYAESAAQVMDLPEIKTESQAHELKDILKQIKERHENVVPTMSRAVLSVADNLQPGEKAELDRFLDCFYGSRIGIRALMGQYISVLDNNYGIIRDMKPAEIFEDVKAEIDQIASHCYGISPNIEFEGDRSLSLTYIPAFLWYIYLEMLKNATRATLESANPEALIKVTQQDGQEDVIIKIQDQGNSFPRRDLNLVYSYSYTTVKEEVNPTDNRALIAGLGYGVPLSRLYAKYYGGDLHIIPSYGIGTDILIYLNKMSSCTEREY